MTELNIQGGMTSCPCNKDVSASIDMIHFNSLHKPLQFTTWHNRLSVIPLIESEVLHCHGGSSAFNTKKTYNHMHVTNMQPYNDHEAILNEVQIHTNTH